MSSDHFSSKCCKSFNYEKDRPSDKRFSLNPKEASSNLLPICDNTSKTCSENIQTSLSLKPIKIQVVKQIRNQRTRPHSFLGK